MKHLRKFNEDKNSEFENDQDISDLRESLLEVSDRLGEPNINTFKIGTEIGYVVQYNIPIATIGEMTTDAFYEAVDALYSTKEDILQTADRFADRFQTTISQMAGKLKIRLTPTKKQEGGYKFIVKAESREVEVSKSELRRWAMDNGLTLTNVEEDDDEGAEMTSLGITFSGKPNGLLELLIAEKDAIEAEQGELDREFEIAYAYGDEKTIWLTPEEEKTYIYGV
jgi:hypothetical protein